MFGDGWCDRKDQMCAQEIGSGNKSSVVGHGY